jgi:crossover junction endodeoxyribonuclease RuvC
MGAGTMIADLLDLDREPPYVIGVDSALARTGVGIIERVGDSVRARTFVISTALTDDSVAGQNRRIKAVAAGVKATIPPDGGRLALIEAPAYDAFGGNALERAAVWYHIVDILLHLDIPLATVTPMTLKKWVTGSGGSTKHPVEKRHIVAGMHQMWPGLPCTSSDLRHHECEALAMAHMCAQHLGWPIPVRKHHGVPLAVVKWP